MHLPLRLPCLRCLAVNYVGSNCGCVEGEYRHFQHHICINRQLCGVEVEVYGCVEG